MRELKISGTTLVALVDDEDYERLSKYTWRLTGNGNIVSRQDKTRGYNRIIPMSQTVCNNYKKMFDHKDRNSLNNCKDNLRSCSYAQNGMNSGKRKTPTSSIFKGVTWHKGAAKWQAQIKYNFHQTYLGRFKSEVDAAITYNIAAFKHFGDFACFNPVPFTL